MNLEELEEAVKAHKKLFDVLKADFELLVRQCPSARTQIKAWANAKGNAYFDQTEVKKCIKFAKKYRI
jgi:hypothetical protein